VTISELKGVSTSVLAPTRKNLDLVKAELSKQISQENLTMLCDIFSQLTILTEQQATYTTGQISQ
jgi:hypothetical protein